MTVQGADEAARCLAGDPWIDSAVVMPGGLRIRPSESALAVFPPGVLVAEYLEHWREVYDWTYSRAAVRQAADLDLSGWLASDTGKPFEVAHMREWIAGTVNLVLRYQPRWVLELGCGTGLLAHRLRDRVSGYVGTDVAASVLDALSANSTGRAVFIRAAAHEAAGRAVRLALDQVGCPVTGPDCVLLNSVTQCFPDVTYLRAVVRKAVGLVAPGGIVVIGDVRHAGLLPHFCRWLERVADPAADDTEIERRARARAATDTELLFDPATLADACSGTGRDVRIAVYPKLMRADTELTRYRFDAVLHIDSEPTGGPTATATVRWDGAADPLVVARSTSGPARITGIPNRLLTDHPLAVTPCQLAEAVRERDAAVILDPTALTGLAVVTPAVAATVPIDEVDGRPGHAHEPFPAFVTRRLTEAARRVLRRERPAAAGLPIEVCLPDQRGLAERAAVAGDRVGGNLAGAPDLARRLDQGALCAMASTLAVPLLFGPGRFHTWQEIAAALDVHERHHWILRRWLAVLVDEGWLSRDDVGRFVDLRPVLPAEAAAADRALDDARDILGYSADLARFFRAATRHLPDLLRDRIPLQALLFPDGEVRTAEGAYRDNAVNRYINAAMAEVVRTAARPHEDGPLRVTEVGGGVGASTADALAALGEGPVDYLFTDVSRFFLDEARARLAGRSGVRFDLFDINAAGPGEAGRHLILAANVLHNAHDIGRTLRLLRDMLEPGGLLLFVETCREQYQVLISLQFLMSPRPGRQLPGVGDLRAGTDRIFLGGPEWLAELRRAGLTPVLCLPPVGHPLDALAVRLFVARRG